jgi:HK97 family phage major capsid protein
MAVSGDVTLRDIMDEVKGITYKLNERVDMLDKEQKHLGDVLTSQSAQMPAEYKDGMARMNADLNGLMKDFRDMQLAALRPGIIVAGYDSPQVKAQVAKHEAKSSFIAAIKASAKGDTYLDTLKPEQKQWVKLSDLPLERKTMYNADATTGGFFAMPEFVDDLIKDIVLISQFRALATVYQTSMAWIEIPKRTGISSAYWAVEQARYTQSNDPRLGMVKIYPHEMRGLLQVSLQNLEDSVFPIADFVQSELAEQFAYLEGSTFITGDGNEKPEGVMFNSQVSYIPAGSTTTLNPDVLLKCMHALKSVYRANSTWIFTTATLGNLRLMKDSQNRPLWQPFAAGGLPATIYDRPYVEMPAMDDANPDYTYNANEYPVAIGDFKRSYVIADRVQMSLTRLSELYAESGLVGFIARKRVGGMVVLPQAIKKIKMSVS